MGGFTSPRAELAQIDVAVANLSPEIASVQQQRKREAADASRLALRVAYLKFASLSRTPSELYPAWRLTALICGPLAAGALSFVLLNAIDASRTFEFGLAFAAVVMAFMSLVSLFYNPGDEQLPTSCSQAQMAKTRAEDILIGTTSHLAELNRKHALLLERRRQITASVDIQREALLDRNWRAMRDNEWEAYLREVFVLLSAKVTHVGKSGDQGVDLLVEFGKWRIAVQAKGYYNSVSNGAVQEAFTGAKHWGCNSCAVITNSRFTKSAKELAASTQCILIGEEDIPAFVMGRLPLFSAHAV